MDFSSAMEVVYISIIPPCNGREFPGWGPHKPLFDRDARPSTNFKFSRKLNESEFKPKVIIAQDGKHKKLALSLNSSVTKLYLCYIVLSHSLMRQGLNLSVA